MKYREKCRFLDQSAIDRYPTFLLYSRSARPLLSRKPRLGFAHHEFKQVKKHRLGICLHRVLQSFQICFWVNQSQGKAARWAAIHARRVLSSRASATSEGVSQSHPNSRTRQAIRNCLKLLQFPVPFLLRTNSSRLHFRACFSRWNLPS